MLDDIRNRLNAATAALNARVTPQSVDPFRLIENWPEAARAYRAAVEELHANERSTAAALDAARARLQAMQDGPRPLPGTDEFDQVEREVRSLTQHIAAAEQSLPTIRALIPGHDALAAARAAAVETFSDALSAGARMAVRAIEEVIIRDDKCLHSAMRITEQLDRFERARQLANEITGVEIVSGEIVFPDGAAWRAIAHRRHPQYVVGPSAANG